MNPVVYVFLIVAIFGIEIGLSFLLNTTTLTILTKRPFLSIKLSGIANILYWIRLFVVVKLSDFDIGLIIASAFGDMAGDWLVAKRIPRFIWDWMLPKKKKIYRGKNPFTNA